MAKIQKKYEKPLKINGTLDDVLKISTDYTPKEKVIKPKPKKK